MTETFNYVFVQQSQDSLVVGDIGNCYIETCNDSGEEYFLAIRTSLGITRTAEYGPYADGIRCTSVVSIFNQFDYNEKRIKKTISAFLNSPGRNITQAFELDREEWEEIREKLDNPIKLLYD